MEDLDFEGILPAVDAPNDYLKIDDQSANDNLEIDTPEPEQEAEPAETPEGEGEEEAPTDGRKLPDDVRKALKALRDSSPENAKAARALNDVYGREQAYKQVFPTVKDAQTAQGTIQTIESFGGLDAVQATIAEIEEIDNLLLAGDSKAIEKIFEVSGEGFSKLAPAMLDKLQSTNSEAYASAIRPHLVSAIGQSGLSDAVSAVIQAFGIAQTPGATGEFKAKFEKDATDGLQKIHQYLQSLGKTPATPTTPVAGGTDKLSEREQALATKEAQHFNNEVGNLANGKMNVSLEKAITPYLRQLKLAPQAKSDLVSGIYAEVAKLAKADKNYQTTKDNLFKSKTRDAGAIARLMAGKFDSVVGQATKTVVDRRYGKTAPAAARPAAEPTTSAAAVPGKPVLVKELPNRNDVDWTKTTDDMMIRGIRVLKSGKSVRLDR